jgi:hypothetical protein
VRMGTKSKADSSQPSWLDKLQTQPGLKLIVFCTFKSILSSSKCDNFSDSSFSDTEQTLIDSQTEIGWQSLLFGNFPQSGQVYKMNTSMPKTLTSGTSSVSSGSPRSPQHIWQALHILWTLYNTRLHGSSFEKNDATWCTYVLQPSTINSTIVVMSLNIVI